MTESNQPCPDELQASLDNYRQGIESKLKPFSLTDETLNHAVQAVLDYVLSEKNYGLFNNAFNCINNSQLIQAYRLRAQELSVEGEVEVDDYGCVSTTETGAYVTAWLFVPEEDLPDELRQQDDE